MRVLLIFKDSVAFERMAVIQISSALKRAGHEVQMWIASVNEPEALHKIMREFKPAILGYSAMTGEHIPLVALNNELREKYDFYTVFGGPHATFCQDFIEEEGIDAICIGEGDAVFPDFCDRMENGDDYWNTPAFFVYYEGKIYRNALNTLVPELSELDFPDRKLLCDLDPNMAARGCPY
jgi:anaerobic magnesium-protoporphyrin IX monomethyl ester cyclase